ncbi:hypothetical protein WMF38_39645 [Sorangium sp. So ce118]
MDAAAAAPTRTRVPEDGARAALALLALVASIMPELDKVDGAGPELARR